MNRDAQILLVDLCYEKASLSRYEFVHPIRASLDGSGFPCRTMHYSEVDEEAVEGCDKIILCGTALKDNTYTEHLQDFAWLKDLKKPVLGICAGMQVISLVFGGEIFRHPAIGLEAIEIIRDSPLLGIQRQIDGYHLHNYAVTMPAGFLLLAGKPHAPEAFQHCSYPVFGIIFHPEVRNRWILERFANL